MALWGGGRLKTLEIEDGGPTWPPLKNDDVILPSSTHCADIKGDSFRRTIYPLSPIVIALMLLKF